MGTLRYLLFLEAVTAVVRKRKVALQISQNSQKIPVPKSLF